MLGIAPSRPGTAIDTQLAPVRIQQHLHLEKHEPPRKGVPHFCPVFGQRWETTVACIGITAAQQSLSEENLLYAEAEDLDVLLALAYGNLCWMEAYARSVEASAGGRNEVFRAKLQRADTSVSRRREGRPRR
jgi:hypothetical protein